MKYRALLIALLFLLTFHSCKKEDDDSGAYSNYPIGSCVLKTEEIKYPSDSIFDHTIYYEYDSLYNDRLIKRTIKDSRGEIYEHYDYDVNGRVKTILKQFGPNASMDTSSIWHYDQFGQLIRIESFLVNSSYSPPFEFKYRNGSLVEMTVFHSPDPNPGYPFVYSVEMQNGNMVKLELIKDNGRIPTTKREARYYYDKSINPYKDLPNSAFVLSYFSYNNAVVIEEYVNGVKTSESKPKIHPLNGQNCPTFFNVDTTNSNTTYYETYLDYY